MSRKSAERRIRDDRGKGHAPPAGLDGVGVTDGSFIAHGQLVAAASPAPRQHRSAVLALHSGAKSVRLGALTIVRLKRSLGHVWDSPGAFSEQRGDKPPAKAHPWLR